MKKKNLWLDALHADRDAQAAEAARMPAPKEDDMAKWGVNWHRERAEAALTEAAELRAERDEWRQRRDALAAENTRLRAERDALRAENARLRAVAAAAERLLMQVQRTDGWTENYRALAAALAASVGEEDHA